LNWKAMSVAAQRFGFGCRCMKGSRVYWKKKMQAFNLKFYG